MRQRKQKRQQNRNLISGLLPGFLCVAVLPFIVRLYLLPNTYASYPWFAGSDTWGDLFLYGKMKCFLAISFLMLFVIFDAILVKREKITLSRAFWLLFGYETLVTLSAIFSVDRMLSFRGGLEQFESVYVLWGYGICCLYGHYLQSTKKNTGLLLTAMVVASFVLSIIGLFQFVEHDILQWDFIKSFYVPNDLKAYRESLSFNFAKEKWNNVYMTLYNPNYVGSYVCLSLPIAVWKFLESRKLFWRIFSGATAMGLLVCLLGSGSKAGILSLCIALLMAGVFGMIHKRKIGKKDIVIGSLVIMVVCMTGGLFAWKVVGNKKTENAKDKELLTEITLGKDEIFIEYNGYPLTIGYQTEDGKPIPIFRDESGNAPMCEYAVDEQYYVIIDERMKDVAICCYREGEQIVIGIAYDETQWIFCKLPGQAFRYVTRYKKPDEMVVAKTCLPREMDSLFTYRGYIWSRTIPLLQNHFLLGSGPDTFAIVFPQNDYVARSKQEKGFFDEILTRPHSMYLQWALQTGVLSFLCMVAFLGVVVRRAVSRLHKDIHDKEMAAVSVGIVAYLSAGICNDSSLVAAPVFWLLFGLLCGMVLPGKK